MAKRKIYTLDDLNSRKASETAYSFEFKFDGAPSGIILSVVGQQSETFESRAQALAKEAALTEGLEGSPLNFLVSPRGVLLTNKLVAARLVGWTGIKEELTDETALQFVTNTAGASDQIIEASNKIGNFIKL